MDSKNNFIKNELIALLRQSTIDWKSVLATIVSNYDCNTGTLHWLSTPSSTLQLEAQISIPDFLIPKLSEIPIGKGMAGIAAERREPVEMCNLQTDNSGVARPAAKETKVAGSIAIPMILNNTLFGVLGIAKPIPYEFSEKEKTELLKIGEEISKFANHY